MDNEFKYCPICGHMAKYFYDAPISTLSIQCSNPKCAGYNIRIKDFHFESEKTGDKNQKTADELYLASINLGIRLITQIKPENKWYLRLFLEAEIIDAIDYFKQKAGVSISDKVE